MMLISFHSKACADFFMLGAHAQAILELMGKPFSTQGVIAAAQLTVAINALETGLLAQEEHLKATAQTNEPDDAHDPFDDAPPLLVSDANVSLRQRAWPLMDMMKRSQAKQVDVVWGV
jgi:hypothetical protein